MEEIKVKHYSNRKSGFVFGVILMLAGVLFLAFNFGWLDSGFRKVIFSWQMLLVIIGFINYYYRHFFSGTLFILIGGFFLIPRLAMASPDVFYWATEGFTSTYWPVLLIAGGILIIFQWIFHPKWKTVNYYSNTGRVGHKEHSHRRTTIRGNQGFEKNSVFANVEEIILEPEFTGGEINAVFGGITLDLRKTNLTEGETTIELNAVFGGVTLFVPENWYVELHLSSVFGGFQDNRVLGDNIDHSRKLVIIGSCVFGGGEVRN